MLSLIVDELLALYDLGKELANKNYSLPKDIYLQMDNCGENKVRFRYFNKMTIYSDLSFIC